MRLKEAFQGSGLVCRFSLVQLLKSRGNRIALLLALLLTVASSALTSLLEPEAVQDTEESFLQQRYAEEGLSQEQIELLDEGVFAAVWEEELWQEQQADSSEYDTDTSFSVQMAYSVILMMGCTLASSFIVRAVVDEKASKLVDLLLVSVKPAALLLGKVLAMQLYTGIYLLVCGLGLLLSPRFMEALTGTPAKAGLLNGLTDLKMTPLCFLVLLITFLLGFLFFCLIAGLSGAGCSTLEESGGAMGAGMVLLMLGYFAGVVLSSAGLVTPALCVIPVLSTFLVPTSYLLGQIGLGAAALSWCLMLALDLFLVRMAARLYEALIVYRGRRISFGKILRASFQKGGALL